MTGAVVEADPTRGGGHAVIRIPRGATGVADPRLRLSRDGYEAGTLGPGGWQVAEALIAPLAARGEGDDLVLWVGPAVVDRIESGVVMLAVPSIAFGEPVFWPDLPLSPSGQGNAKVMLPMQSPAKPPPIQVQRKVESSSRPVEAPSTPPPVTLPIADFTTPSRHPRQLLPWLAATLLFIAVAVGGGIWWATRPSGPLHPLVQAQAPVPVPIPPAPQRDCTAGSIPAVVACAPDPDTLYKLGALRWDEGQANDGLVLMQIAADRGSGAAALRLAQLYDPATFRPGGPILHTNAREAAQYYRRAAQAHQDGVDAPRQALRRRLQGDADAGDTLAGLTLKDFWP
jgi:hypothetical protein